MVGQLVTTKHLKISEANERVWGEEGKGVRGRGGGVAGTYGNCRFGTKKMIEQIINKSQVDDLTTQVI